MTHAIFISKLITKKMANSAEKKSLLEVNSRLALKKLSTLFGTRKFITLREVCGSQYGVYEDCSVLECDAV
jgi:hypothetical protein